MRQRGIGLHSPGSLRHGAARGRRARRAAAACAAVGAILFPAVAAGPPPPGGGAGCGGAACWTWALNYVHFSGNGYTGAVNGSIPIPAPPCWMQPWMTAAEMYSYFETYIAAGNTGGGAAWAPFAQQIIQLYKQNAQGEWWGSNFDGSLAGSSCVGNLPLIQWVPAGAPPPLGWIPPRTLAWLALSRLTPAPPALSTNPRGRSYVDLPTFVTATIPRGDPLSVTASVPGESETVVATPLTQGALVLSASGGTPTPPCGPFGSAYSAARMAATGPGGAMDCGVTYSAPSVGGPYPLSGTLYWQATWNGQLLAPPPDLAATGAAVPIAVAEVQSINRGRKR
jgi:enoyl reductase